MQAPSTSNGAAVLTLTRPPDRAPAPTIPISESTARLLGALAVLAIGLIHILDAAATYHSTRWIFWAYMALIAGAVPVALLLLWGPEHGFPVIYLGQPEVSVVAEAQRRFVDPVLDGMPTEFVAPRDLLTVDVDVDELLDLRDPRHLAAVGLDDEALRGPWPLCVCVARAAHQLGIHGGPAKIRPKPAIGVLAPR